MRRRDAFSGAEKRREFGAEQTVGAGRVACGRREKQPAAYRSRLFSKERGAQKRLGAMPFPSLHLFGGKRKAPVFAARRAGSQRVQCSRRRRLRVFGPARGRSEALPASPIQWGAALSRSAVGARKDKGAAPRPQPTKAIISNEQKSGIRKGSNRASTGKVGALLLSIYRIIASLRFCNCRSIMEASGGAGQ